jgi:hypothetical protein
VALAKLLAKLHAKLLAKLQEIGHAWSHHRPWSHWSHHRRSRAARAGVIMPSGGPCPGGGRPHATWKRDAARPVGTGGGTRRVRLVRGEGRGGKTDREAKPDAPLVEPRCVHLQVHTVNNQSTKVGGSLHTSTHSTPFSELGRGTRGAACPVSTGGGARRVRLVREKGRDASG